MSEFLPPLRKVLSFLLFLLLLPLLLPWLVFLTLFLYPLLLLVAAPFLLWPLLLSDLFRQVRGAIALFPALRNYPLLLLRLVLSQLFLLGSALFYVAAFAYLFHRWDLTLPPLGGWTPPETLSLLPLFGLSQLFVYLWQRGQRVLGASHTLAGSFQFAHLPRRFLPFVFDKGEARPYPIFLIISLPYVLCALYLILFIFHYHIFYYVIYDRPPLNPFFYALALLVAFVVSPFLYRVPNHWPDVYSEDALSLSRWGDGDHTDVVLYEFQIFRYRKTGWDIPIRQLEEIHYPRFPPPHKGRWFFRLPDWWQWPYRHDPRNRGQAREYMRLQHETYRPERFFYYDPTIRRVRFSYNDVPPVREDNLMESFVAYGPHHFGAKGYLYNAEPFYDEKVEFDPRLLRRYGQFQDPDTDEVSRFAVDVRPRPAPPPFDIEDFWEFQKMMMDPYYFLRKGRPGKFY